MKKSEHRYIDRYGYRCAVEIICEDDEIVVFDSTPKLSFDYKKHGIKIKREKFDDYVITYVMKNGNLFFRSFLAPLSFLSRKGQIFGVTPEPYFDGKLSCFFLENIVE